MKYRVNVVVADLGLVDLHPGCSTVCPDLFGQLEIWQNRLGNWAMGQIVEYPNQTKPTHVSDRMNYPVCSTVVLPFPIFR